MRRVLGDTAERGAGAAANRSAGERHHLRHAAWSQGLLRNEICPERYSGSHYYRQSRDSQVDAKARSERFEVLLGPYNTAKYRGNEGGRGRKLTLVSRGHHVLVHVHSLVLGVTRHLQKRRIPKLPNPVSPGAFGLPPLK